MIDRMRYPPYVHDWKTSAKAAWICSLTLAPVVAWSLFLYGPGVAVTWLSSLLAAVSAETLACGLSRRWTLGDGSAVLTGLLIAAAMPPFIPFYIPAVSAAFAVLIVKAAFGGLGANWMNPAIAGVAFAYANWPKAMRECVLPRVVAGVDGMSSSTPLSFAKGLASGVDMGIMDALRGASYPLSAVDSSVTGFLNDVLFAPLGARLPEGYIDLAIGFRPGVLGESALIAIALGSIVLVGLRLVKPLVPVAMAVSFSVLVWVFGTGLPGEGFASGDVLFALANGGFLLAAFYLAVDPVTSPVGRAASLAYGIALGAISFAFRRWGAYAEGSVYAILLMNVMTPTLERIVAGLNRGSAARKGVSA